MSTGKPAEDLFEGAHTEDVKHMHHYLKLIVECDMPINTCNKKEHRQQSEFHSPLHDEKVRETMCKLAKIVEAKINNESKLHEKCTWESSSFRHNKSKFEFFWTS